MIKKKICYLCGKDINKDKSKDHVPPKQFYPKKYKNNLKFNLLTLPTHKICNTDYQKDEVYFLHSLGPIAMDTGSGSAIWDDIKHAATKKSTRFLIQKVNNQFTHRPYGLYLPKYLVAMKVEGYRIERIIWKITRGLYFHEYNELLPENTIHIIEFYDQYHKPREEFNFVRDTESRGKYPGVFDYKILDTDKYIMWGLLFWDYYIAFIINEKP